MSNTVKKSNIKKNFSPNHFNYSHTYYSAWRSIYCYLFYEISNNIYNKKGYRL